MSETELKKACTDVCDELGLTWLRANAGGYRGRMKGAKKGTPDLHVRLPPDGRWLAVETKASHADRQRSTGGCSCESCTAQRAWARAHERDGGVYLQVTRLEQLTDFLLPFLKGRS